MTTFPPTTAASPLQVETLQAETLQAETLQVEARPAASRVVGVEARGCGRLGGPDRLALAYLGVLLATSVVQAALPAASAHALLAFVSTDLHRLARAPVFVLAASAFWVDGWAQFALAAVAFALLWGVQERIGVRRRLAVFALGHVGATVAVAAVELVVVAAGWGSAGGIDVGFSYGWCALAGLAWSGLDRVRRGVVGLVALGLLVGFVTGDAFTALGHVLALAIGVVAEARSHRVGSAAALLRGRP